MLVVLIHIQLLLELLSLESPVVLTACLLFRRHLASIGSINLSSHLAYKLLALLVLVDQPPHVRLHFALQEFPPLNLL